MARITIGRRLTQAQDSVTAAQGSAGAQPWPVRDVTNLIPAQFDFIGLSYTGGNLSAVVYKTGGAGGTTVATLALGYTAGKLTSVTRT